MCDDNFKCDICGKETIHNIVELKEIMNGTQKKFKYFECENCKSLQIESIPEDLSNYYNHDYVSFQYGVGIVNKLTNLAVMSRFDNNILGRIVKRIFNKDQELYEILFHMLKHNNINFNSEILDVGCGIGIFLQELNGIGFKNLDGMEPFIDNDLKNGNINIHKSFLDDFNPDKKYDLIFLKDSLEHMNNPFEKLSIIKSLLKDNNSYIIVNIPIKTNYIWDIYGGNWFQLDAPRHLITFTLQGFNELCENVGLKVIKTKFNSTEPAFVISEDFSNNLNLYGENSYSYEFYRKPLLLRTFNRLFSRKKYRLADNKIRLSNVRKIVKNLNDNEMSDHALFILKKSN